MNNLLKKQLNKCNVVYVTRDIERALGLDSNASIHIISNKTDFAKQAVKDRTQTLLIDSNRILDTRELLNHPDVQSYINNLKDPLVVVFKNTKLIEKACDENEWKLLNPSSELVETVENKLSQIDWLGELSDYLPLESVKVCKDITWENKAFILQFNRSHTGSGTHLIDSEEKLEELKTRFPNREARIMKYINGPVFTSNNIVSADKILFGNISYQITGLSPFTDNQFATIGNDWGAANKLFSSKLKKQYENMAGNIGDKLKDFAWKGLFGIDVILDQNENKLYLVEINARQPASSIFESELQEKARSNNQDLTVFEAHVLSLLNIDLDDNNLISIDSGSQIVQRVTDKYTLETLNKDLDRIEKKLSNKNCKLISYESTKPDSELLKIQCPDSVMSDHKELNELGKLITIKINN